MELKEVYQEVFQAMSALSDAQELMDDEGSWPGAGAINHAKRHLLAVIKADEHGFVEAMRDLPLTCTLPEEGEP
jgi:hypothetical protein